MTRVVATGGGTAGHVYPALAVVRALQEIAGGQAEVLYIGQRGGMEEQIVTRAGLPMESIASGALRGRSPWGLAANLGQIAAGTVQGIGVLRRFNAQAILATGGYGCVPAVLAGWLLRIPSLVYLPDMRPGMAVSLLARLARKVAITAEEAATYLPAGKTVVTGYPVRPELQPLPRGEARSRLDLPAEGRVLLILGGSRGAHSLNEAVFQGLDELVELGWVVHSCGREEYSSMLARRDRLAEAQQDRYRPYPYLGEEMSWAVSAADLAVSRAGASTLGELPAFGLPAILVPYPYAGAHQRWNAEYLAARGAAVILPDEDLRRGQFLPLVQSLLTDGPKLGDMAERSRTLTQPQAASHIARELIGLAEGR